MTLTIYYSSGHGMTKRAATRIAQRLGTLATVVHINEAEPSRVGRDPGVAMFLAPTYGDEELHDEMHRFIESVAPQIRDRAFVVGELGNTYGYDDQSYGAMRNRRNRLLRHGGVEYFGPISIDSFPRQDWETLDRWTDGLAERIRADAGS